MNRVTQVKDIMKKLLRRILVSALLLLVACSQKPGTIHYGSDECAHCKMMITDNRFASQLVTKTGKVIKFDAIECMAAYAGNHKSQVESAKMWVSNFDNPGHWIELHQALFIKSEVIKSPMGESLLALESEQAAKTHLQQYDGQVVKWKDIK